MADGVAPGSGPDAQGFVGYGTNAGHQSGAVRQRQGTGQGEQIPSG